MNNIIELENAYNVREIGGYKTSDGKVIKNNLFLRADCLGNLSQKDIDTLITYGLGSVIDLRSANELEQRPNPFNNYTNIKYINIPFMADTNSNNIQDATKIMMENPKEMMPMFYINILKNSTQRIKNAFIFIEENLDKTTLFHCTAGKDRTGVLAMLLLGLCGVSKEDIIANYIVTFENNKKNPNYTTIAKELPLGILLSEREYIIPAIEYIENHFNSYYDYLLSTGIDKSTLDNIKNKLSI